MTTQPLPQSGANQPPPVLVTCSAGARSRATRLVVGWRYIIDPIHPAKTKNQGRTCILTTFDPQDLSEVHVWWEDTRRTTAIDTKDLRECPVDGTAPPLGNVEAVIPLDRCWKDVAPGSWISAGKTVGLVAMECGSKLLLTASGSDMFGALCPVRDVDPATLPPVLVDLLVKEARSLKGRDRGNAVMAARERARMGR